MYVCGGDNGKRKTSPGINPLILPGLEGKAKCPAAAADRRLAPSCCCCFITIIITTAVLSLLSLLGDEFQGGSSARQQRGRETWICPATEMKSKKGSWGRGEAAEIPKQLPTGTARAGGVAAKPEGVSLSSGARRSVPPAMEDGSGCCLPRQNTRGCCLSSRLAGSLSKTCPEPPSLCLPQLCVRSFLFSPPVPSPKSLFVRSPTGQKEGCEWGVAVPAWGTPGPSSADSLFAANTFGLGVGVACEKREGPEAPPDLQLPCFGSSCLISLLFIPLKEENRKTQTPESTKVSTRGRKEEEGPRFFPTPLPK